MPTNSIGKTKKAKYTKLESIDKNTQDCTYDVYHFETDTNQVLLDADVGDIPKGTKLQATLERIKNIADTGGQGAKDLATHVANKNNPHGVTKAQVGLGSVVNAGMDDNPTSGSNNYVKSGGVYTAVKDAKDKADAAYGLASGRSRAFVFNDVSGLTSGTLPDKSAISGYKLGDSIYIVATNVADFWISAIGTTGTASTTTVIQNAKAGASVVVKWGTSYITLTAVENKEDLSNYSTTAEIAETYRRQDDSYDRDTIDKKVASAITELHADIKIPYSYINGTIDLNPSNVEGGIDTAYEGFGLSEDMTLAEPVNWNDANSIRLWVLGLNIYTAGDTPLSILMKQTGATDGAKWEGVSLVKISADDENGVTRYYTYRVQAIASKADLIDSELSKAHVTLYFNLLGEGFAPAIADTKTILEGDISAEFSNKGGTVTATLPDKVTAGTYSTVEVDAKGRVIAGGLSYVFASSLKDSALDSLSLGGIAIIG